ncbi:putative RING-H2 finger protein ATL49 [Lolium rigidum]|uniref:putative RING-H2 finger protein ATL49 n=1 Tax=Lolium rigidum TaxID=89674 RepID=UPI001F5E2626|nr:putative RING-H2 finger protein ATL49 [Lolium rigidum]
MDASSSSTAAAPPPTHSVLDTIQTKLSPGVLLIVAILAMVFFIFGLLNLLVQNILRLRRARQRRLRIAAGDVDGSSPTALQGQLQQLFHLHDAGVDQAFIDALPVFVYRAILGAGKRKDVDPFDCAVCLCEFGMEDSLRLLPTCGHAFHVPCIDAWLLSHSTCPLCRGSVLADNPSPASSPIVLVLESDDSHADTATDRDAPGVVDSQGSPKVEEEVVEVKLGKLRCLNEGNADSGELAVEATSRNDLGRRRCLSMGSYEYVMDDHAALRVAVKTPKKQRPRSRRRHLSECDFKKGAWETAVKEAAAPVDAGTRRVDDGGAVVTARLSKDSFSASKIWMVPPAKKQDGRTLASSRRSVSFRWPAMSEVSRHDGVNEEPRDVESQSGNVGSNAVPSVAERRPPSPRTTPLWVAGGWQPSGSGGSNS